MKKIIALLMICAMIMASLTGCGSQKAQGEDAAKSEEKKVIRVATQGEYYPWTYMDAGEVVGVEIDIWKEIASRMGYKVEFEKIDFSGQFGLLDADKADTIACQISKTAEREEKYNFSVPYAYNPMVVVVNKNANISTLQDLDGKSVIIRPTNNTEVMAKQLEEAAGITLKRIVSSADGVLEVHNERADIMLLGKLAMAEMLKKAPDLNVKVGLETPIVEVNAYPFRKNERGDRLRAETDKAIESMREDGTLSKIYEDYFGVDISEEGGN